MDVELAQERMLLLADRFNMDHAEGRAWIKRTDAFGTMAKIGSFLSRPKDEDFETVYRERRLQPFYHVACTATMTYERAKDYRVPVDPNVVQVEADGKTHPVDTGAFTISGVERCHDEIHRAAYYDAISGAADAGAALYLGHNATLIDADILAKTAADGAVVVPPQAKASMLVRDVLASSIERITADRVLEEKLSIHHIDLYYRPVYAFRYRWQGKEAVVEFDGVTGETKVGGNTFEQFLGRAVDAEFLINAGVEAAGILIPGARLAEIVISKSIKAAKAK
ncbi:hypothetical protein FPZ24_13460 [Sphingomonas panacisoli]|uniref:Uncharacterized protein n=1 Tax=Sphingomonas panacisoli TaxID=1813879 RepID=A0A5B8LMS8_9SPHN|nr:hypothetical protein [Sphingomonas panacisoli]QDZ08360.1 hypothetical protein FPZ24_13460 [Sphingomonas panacisoli]